MARFNILYGSMRVEALHGTDRPPLFGCFNILYGSMRLEAALVATMRSGDQCFNILYGSMRLEAIIASALAFVGILFQYPLRIDAA